MVKEDSVAGPRAVKIGWALTGTARWVSPRVYMAVYSA